MASLSKEQQMIILGLIVSIVVGFGVLMAKQYYFSHTNHLVIEEPISLTTASQDQGNLLIQVSGAVRREGVYRLKIGDRKLDALKLAGGALRNADLANLNLAEPIKDGERVVVPIKRGSCDNQNPGVSETNGRLININLAKAEDFDKLPGIGPSTAKAIIEYRQKIGSFNRLEQLLELSRFGKAKFERIKDLITL